MRSSDVIVVACALAFVAGAAAGCTLEEEKIPARFSSTGKHAPIPPPAKTTDGAKESVPTKDDPPPADSGPPTASAIAPDAITLGTAPSYGVDLVVTGTRFAGTMQIDLAGDTIEATVTSATSLTARVPASKLGVSGVYRIAVTKSGAQSNALTFTVANPTSVQITNLTPAFATIGVTGAIDLALTGSGFVPTSVVRFNGSALTTKFGSAMALSATIPASTFLDAGKYGVTVSNGTDVVSLPTSFEVRNPIPATTSMTPTSAVAGSASIAVTLTGSGFTKSSSVLASNSPLATTFVSATQLRATVPSTLMTTARTLSLVVQSPGPGGGTSGGRTFTVQAAAAGTGSSGGAAAAGSGSASCLYHCLDYGYAPGQCYQGWYCYPTGTYAGCLGQAQCN